MKIYIELVLALFALWPMDKPTDTYAVNNHYIIGPGAASGADSGVLESVAANRYLGLTDITIDDEYLDYAILVATQSCEFVGRHGLFVTPLFVRKIYVVDCQNTGHIENEGLHSRHLIADFNKEYLYHQYGYLIIDSDITKPNINQ